MRSKEPTLQKSLLISLVPLASFAVLIILVTAWLLGAMDEQATVYVTALEAGELGREDVVGIVGGMKAIWMVCLAGFVLFSGGTSILALRVHSSVKGRVERLIKYAECRAEGEMCDAPVPKGSGPLAMLERAMRRISDSMAERDEKLVRDSEVSHFHAQLQRALDLADTQHATLEVTERALTEIIPGAPNEVLLADSSVAHMRRVASASEVPAPGCPVEHPFECAAVRRGRTLVFDTSEALDACPRLRREGCGPIGAVCSPLNVMGRTIGALHVVTQENQPPSADVVNLLEVVANQTGARLGMLRTLETTQLQAQTDPLTGLLNRRSFEESVGQTLREHGTANHAIALFDLDHFKRLNDTAGHEAGDRALQLFAEVLKASVRPTDIVGRHGGEEFVACLVDVSEDKARAALERVRQELRRAVRRSAGPAFTTSIGGAIFPTDGADVPKLLRQADRALYAAKEGGRDRTVLTADLASNSTSSEAIAS